MILSRATGRYRDGSPSSLPTRLSLGSCSPIRQSSRTSAAAYAVLSFRHTTRIYGGSISCGANRSPRPSPARCLFLARAALTAAFWAPAYGLPQSQPQPPAPLRTILLSHDVNTVEPPIRGRSGFLAVIHERDDFPCRRIYCNTGVISRRCFPLLVGVYARIILSFNRRA